MVERIEVAEYADLASRTELSSREIDHVVAELDESDTTILVLREWLVDEKPLEAIDGWVRLFKLDVLLRETDKAWRVRVGDEDAWVPKSQSVLVSRADDVDEIDTPSATLTDFGSAGGEA